MPPLLCYFEADSDTELDGSPIDVYYDIVDDRTDTKNPEDNFGLLDSSMNPKPAYTAVTEFHSELSGRTFAGLVKTQTSTLRVLREDGSDDTLYVVWLNTLESTATIVLPPKATATDLYGSKITLSIDGANQICHLTESQGPVYIHLSNLNLNQCRRGNASLNCRSRKEIAVI